jgi:plastocyanin
VSVSRSALIVCVALLAATCGGKSANPGAPSPTDNPIQMTISASGVLTPSELVVSPGTRVLFINNHSQRHHMSSDPHPDHGDCPPMDQVGVLTQGQRRESGNFVSIRTCGLHDHEDPDNPALRGRIVVR